MFILQRLIQEEPLLNNTSVLEAELSTGIERVGITLTYQLQQACSELADHPLSGLLEYAVCSRLRGEMERRLLTPTTLVVTLSMSLDNQDPETDKDEPAE